MQNQCYNNEYLRNCDKNYRNSPIFIQSTQSLDICKRKRGCFSTYPGGSLLVVGDKLEVEAVLPAGHRDLLHLADLRRQMLQHLQMLRWLIQAELEIKKTRDKKKMGVEYSFLFYRFWGIFINLILE